MQFVNKIQVSNALQDPHYRNASNFENITVDSDFWDYLSSSFPDLIYPETISSPEEYGNIFRFNKFVQHVRLRQVRVNAQHCNMPNVKSNVYTKQAPLLLPADGVFICFPAYSTENEDTGTWQGTNYSTAASLGLSQMVQSSYSMGGFLIAMT